MKTFKEAAEQLGVTYTTIDRRVSLLGMETGFDQELGYRTVDVDELVARWEARRREVRPRKKDEAFLSVTIRPDQRETIDYLHERLDKSVAAVVRGLLDKALESEDFTFLSATPD